MTAEITTEVPSLVLRFLKEEDAEELSLRIDQNCEHLRRWIQARVATGNNRSQAVCDRAGLKKEGVLRQAEWLYDHYVDLTMNGVLRTEWKEQP